MKKENGGELNVSGELGPRKVLAWPVYYPLSNTNNRDLLKVLLGLTVDANDNEYGTL